MTAAEITTVTNLLTRYCHIVDTKPIDNVADLFWEDATLICPDGDHHNGIAAITTWYRNWDVTMRAPVTELRHRTTSPYITVAGDHATAVSYLDADAIAQGQLITIRGRYNDALHQRNNQWRFSHRHIETWTSPPTRTPLTDPPQANHEDTP